MGKVKQDIPRQPEMLGLKDMPDAKFTKGGDFRTAQPFTVPNLERLLRHMGVTVRFDMMTGAGAFFVGGRRLAESEEGLLIHHIRDELVRLDIGATVGGVVEVLMDLGRQSPFHPMEDWLNGLEWDGIDRIGGLAGSVVTDTELWPVYLRKWLIQVVEGVCGWREAEGEKASLPHVLVLVGAQGVGKTHWLRRLGGAWIKAEAELHLASPSGKDHQIEALKFPMVELSELDGIFRKSDVSHMKSFISREQDSIRAPYERRAVRRPRMTCFCGSVNEAEFLADPTGSRRFWPVSVDAIDWGYAADFAQIWAQAFELWAAGEAWTLTASEDAERARQAVAQHTQISPEEETLREYFRLHLRNDAFPVLPMNRTEILAMIFGKNRIFSPKQVSAMGHVLSDVSGKSRKIGSKQRCWEVPYNEFATDTSTWPKKVSVKSV